MSDEHPRLFDLSEFSYKKTLKFKGLSHPIWTENKAKLIARYLYYFLLITKHGVYIDGFAGPQYPDKAGTWAAHEVLELEPRWLRHFFLCDKRQAKAQALRVLRDMQTPERVEKVDVYCGDFDESYTVFFSPNISGIASRHFAFSINTLLNANGGQLKLLQGEKQATR